MVTENTNTENTSERTRNTWLTHYRNESQKANFDVNRFAGKLAYDRLQVAIKAIHAIGTPFFSNEADLPTSKLLADAVGDALADACEKLLDELTIGKRSTVKTSGCLEI